MSTAPGASAPTGWNDCCRWLILVRAVRVSLMVRVIVLAMAGALITELGWRLVVEVLEKPELVSLADRPAVPVVPELGMRMGPGMGLAVDAHGDLSLHAIASGSPLTRGWVWAMQPLAQLYQASGLRLWTGCILAGLWAIAVWALFGSAIARIAAVYLTYGETIGPVAALRHALHKWPSTAGAPLFVLVAILLLSLPLMAAGLLLRFDFFALLLGLIWFAILIGGIAIAIVAIGLALGWPLMWATVAVERTDSFDAISRAYAYVFQRPLHALFYVIVAAVLGLLAQAALDLLVDGSEAATRWAVASGAGEPRWDDLHTPADSRMDDTGVENGPVDDSRLERWATGTIRFWTLGLVWIAAAFPMAYLWPAATAIYLLLRRLIDATELTEAAYESSPPERGLPPLATDPITQAPRVVEPTSPSTAPPTARRGADPHDPPVAP